MAKLIDITGKALSGEWGTDDETGDGIPVLRTTNFTNEGVVNYNDVVTRIIAKKNIEEKYLREGDIIIEKSGGKPTDKRYPIDQNHAVYVCGGYLDSGYSRCSRHSIRYPLVAEAVLAAIKVQLEFALKQEQLIRQMRGSEKENNLIDKYVGRINYLSQELKKINGRREALFENFAEGIFNETEYQFVKKKYDDEAVRIEKKLTGEKAKKAQLDDVLSLSNEWLATIHKAENVTEIDAGLVKHLVSSVKVFEDNRVEVGLNFAEQRNIFNLIIAEMVGEGHE